MIQHPFCKLTLIKLFSRKNLHMPLVLYWRTRNIMGLITKQNESITSTERFVSFDDRKSLTRSVVKPERESHGISYLIQGFIELPFRISFLLSSLSVDGSDEWTTGANSARISQNRWSGQRRCDAEIAGRRRRCDEAIIAFTTQT